MIAGHGTPDQAPARLFAYRDRTTFSLLIDVLVDASVAYLVRQLQAGADAADFRHLGRRIADGGIRSMVHRTDAAHRRASA
jgi:hypothetical protein